MVLLLLLALELAESPCADSVIVCSKVPVMEGDFVPAEGVRLFDAEKVFLCVLVGDCKIDRVRENETVDDELSTSCVEEDDCVSVTDRDCVDVTLSKDLDVSQE